MIRARSAFIKKVGTVENELQHQNQKNRMLEEDRRLFLRQAQEIKEKYKQEMEKLRNENKKLKTIRDDFINSKKGKSILQSTAYNSTNNINNKLTISSNDENHLRILLDKQKNQTKIKKNMLFTLQDKLKELEQNKIGFIEQNPMMKTARLLENRLDKVMIKYNQAQSIQQTYEQVVKRLKQQRVGYDSQLAGIQTCLKGKQNDFEELLLLAHDATHAKQAAFAQFKRFENRRATVQEMRMKYLVDKNEQYAKQNPQPVQRPSKGQRSSYNTQSNPTYNTSYKHDENYQRQQLNDYQQAFRKLKEVTGVIDSNEIIQKFKTQGLTTNSLEQLQSGYCKRIQSLKEEKDILKKKIDEIKFIRNNDAPARRRLDQIQNDLAKLSNTYERVSLKHSKLSQSMINITSGIQHLKDLTKYYTIDNELLGDTLQQNLKNLDNKIRKMYDIVKIDPTYMRDNYKVTSTAIKAMMNEQSIYKNYEAHTVDDDEQEQEIE